MKQKLKKKTVIMVVILGSLMIILIFGLGAIYFTMNQIRLVEHSTRRTRAVYSAMSAITDILERLRRENPNNFTDYSETMTINNLTVRITVQSRGRGNCPSNITSDFCISANVQY